MSRYDWNNPPPPGTEYEAPEESRSDHSRINLDELQGINQIEPSFSLAPQSHNRAPSPNRAHLRSRSKSHDRRRRRKRSRSYSRRSRSHSRNRRRRSRSHSRRRRRKYSSSRSRSRSPGYRHKQRRRNRHRSGSRSYGARKRSHKSRSISRSHSTSKRSERERKSPRYDYTAQRKQAEYDQDFDGDLIEEEDIKTEDVDDDAGADSQPESDQAPIPFKNDGSFLEMFKKMQEEQKVKEEPPEEIVPKKPVFGAFGKRRGGKVLKTGMVAKVRNVEEDSNTAQDAWSVYMKEVRKYKEVHCDDDSKTRPLVK